MKSRVWETAGIVLALIVIAAIQFSQPYIVGADGNLHSRMALMIARSGFLHALPQAHFSWFATRFSDKDFLYHLYLVPFVTAFGYTAGAKLAAVVAFGMLSATVILLSAAYSFPAGGLAAAVLLLLSPQFLRDMSETRPFVFAVVLTILGVHTVLRKRTKWIFIIALLYGMTHLSAWVIPVFAAAWGVVEWVRYGRFTWKGLLAALTGYGVSFLLHPNFPNNVFYAYLNGILVPWYAFRGGVLELGAEFFPLTTHDVLNQFPVIVFGTAAIAAMISVHRFRLRRETVGWGVATGIFALFALVAKRNITHLYPVFIVFLLSVYRDFKNTGTRLLHDVRGRSLTILIPAGVIVFLFAAVQTVTSGYQQFISGQIYSDHFYRVAAYLHAHVPEGARIFHTNWSDSQFLIGFAPEYQYIETLDPIYMYSYNRDLYALYRNISFGRVEDPYRALKGVFGTEYGYAGKNYFGAFIDQMRHDPGFRIMAEDDLGVVFALNPEASAAGSTAAAASP